MRISPFFIICGVFSIFILAFISFPLAKMILAPPLSSLILALRDGEVTQAIGLSLYTALWASAISFLFGTPLAYILARKEFRGKRFVESVVDVPIVIPHPVIGIAILSAVGQGTVMGEVLRSIGVKIVGSATGIVTVLTFVGAPFYINAVKNAFEMVPVRLERVARTLGASELKAFLLVTFPLSTRSVLSGLLMCSARAISEFGAVVVVAYHPVTAPVLIYERFESFGLRYSQPVAVLLIMISLSIFIALRVITSSRR